MLREIAFANSLAALTAAFYILLSVVGVVSPRLFTFLFNAQFLGANVAALLPKTFSVGAFVATLATLVVTAWLLGYVWAWLYNQFAKIF